MKKTELHAICGFGKTTLAKLSKNQPVSKTIMMRICKELNFDIGDIIEIVEE